MKGRFPTVSGGAVVPKLRAGAATTQKGAAPAHEEVSSEQGATRPPLATIQPEKPRKAQQQHDSKGPMHETGAAVTGQQDQNKPMLADGHAVNTFMKGLTGAMAMLGDMEEKPQRGQRRGRAGKAQDVEPNLRVTLHESWGRKTYEERLDAMVGSGEQHEENDAQAEPAFKPFDFSALHANAGDAEGHAAAGSRPASIPESMTGEDEEDADAHHGGDAPDEKQEAAPAAGAAKRRRGAQPAAAAAATGKGTGAAPAAAASRANATSSKRRGEPAGAAVPAKAARSAAGAAQPTSSAGSMRAEPAVVLLPPSVDSAPKGVSARGASSRAAAALTQPGRRAAAATKPVLASVQEADEQLQHGAPAAASTHGRLAASAEGGTAAKAARVAGLQDCNATHVQQPKVTTAARQRASQAAGGPAAGRAAGGRGSKRSAASQAAPAEVMALDDSPPAVKPGKRKCSPPVDAAPAAAATVMGSAAAGQRQCPRAEGEPGAAGHDAGTHADVNREQLDSLQAELAVANTALQNCLRDKKDLEQELHSEREAKEALQQQHEAVVASLSAELKEIKQSQASMLKSLKAAEAARKDMLKKLEHSWLPS